MDASARSSLVYGLVAAVWITVVASAAQALHLHTLKRALPARPAADAPVHVVKAPPAPAMDPDCSTCAMGAMRAPS